MQPKHFLVIAAAACMLPSLALAQDTPFDFGEGTLSYTNSLGTLIIRNVRNNSDRTVTDFHVSYRQGSDPTTYSVQWGTPGSPPFPSTPSGAVVRFPGGLPWQGNVDSSAVATITGAYFTPLIPAVPEPATWMLLLLGFGAVGLTIRQRRAEATPTELNLASG